VSRLPPALTALAAAAFMNSLRYLPLVLALCCAVLALLLPLSLIVTPILDVLCLAGLVFQVVVWSRSDAR